MTALAELAALSLIQGIGGVTLRALLAHFDDVDGILAATPQALQQVPGIGPRIASAIAAIDRDAARAALAQWQADGLTVLDWNHDDYPPRLRALRDAPPVLFCRGDLRAAHGPALAIVGTRQPQPQSRQFAAAIGENMAARGWAIISGLAWGVDFAAHSGAVQTGTTVAVLGSGLNAPDHEKKAALRATILEQGAICSEMHPETPPAPASLVARNRIISGLARAVIVIEAGENSGTLYTAKFAKAQKRPLLVVLNNSPGNRALLAEDALPLLPGYNDWKMLDKLLHNITPP